MYTVCDFVRISRAAGARSTDKMQNDVKLYANNERIHFYSRSSEVNANAWKADGNPFNFLLDCIWLKESAKSIRKVFLKFQWPCFGSAHFFVSSSTTYY